MYHKPQEPSNEHGGFLLAVGLLGQLDSLSQTDIFQHLKSAHDSTTIGFLLGRAASKLGQMDDNDSRTICLHIPSLFPPNYSVEISMPTQSAAVVSAGMAFLKSSNRVITEMLLN
jgi:anaphase-promoting complex subunit 1